MPPKAKAKAGKQDSKATGKQDKTKPGEDSKKLKAANAGEVLAKKVLTT